MAGLSDFTAENLLNYITGRTAFPSLPSVFLALYTTAPTSDSGTGSVEVSGTGYSRQQVAGSLTTSASAASGATVLSFASVPAWVTVSMYANDTTSNVIPSNAVVSAVTSGSDGTVTISTGTTNTVASGSTIVFSAFAAASGSSGTEPTVTPANITNNAIITFPQASESWGTVTSFGLFNASGGGNLLSWDYLGNYNWLPCTISNADPAVFTATASDYSTNSNVVYTTKFGGQQPSFTSGSLSGLLTVTNLTVDTFNLATSGGVTVITSSTGDGQIRQVATQSIPSSITASFAASALTLQSA